MGGGGGGKGGKTKIYESVQIDALFPDRDNMYVKKLLSYKSQTGDNYSTIKELIKGKSKFIALKRLDNFGFIRTYNGISNSLDKLTLELFIALKTNETDIKIVYKVGKKYKFEFGYDKPAFSYYGGYGTQFIAVTSTWSTSSNPRLTCSDAGSYISAKYGNYCCKSPYTTCGWWGSGSYAYSWRGPTAVKEPTDSDIAFESFEFIDWKIQKWLDNNYSSSTATNITVTKRVIDDLYEVSTTYNRYSIDDNWYKPIIVDGSISREYDDVNDVMKIHLVNVDDSDDTKTLEWPMDESLLIVIAYTSYQNKHPHLLVDYYDQALKELKPLHFFTIPVKHDGNMIDYSKNNALQVWLRDVGMTLPDSIGNSDVKDVVFTLLTKYNVDEIPELDKYIKFVYGDYTHRKNVSVNTGAGTVSYNWFVDNTGDHPRIIRKVSINGYKYMEVLDTTLGDVITHNVTHNDYSCCWRGTAGKEIGYSTSEPNPTYIIPIEGLQKMSLKDFYDTYYGMLHSIAYARKEVHQKWYQTELFQLVLTVVIAVVAVMTGHPEVAMMVIASYAAVKVLVAMGVDPTVAAIIVAIVSFGVSMYTSGAQVATAGSTATTTGADVCSAGSISMSGTAANVSATTTTSAATATSTSIGQSISNTASQIWQGIQNSFTLSWSNAANFMNASNQVLGIYSAVETYQNQQELEKMQKEADEINKQAKDLADKLDEVFKNSFNWYPRAEFDIQYNMIYSDPMANQIAMDTALYDAPFDIINKTLN